MSILPSDKVKEWRELYPGITLLGHQLEEFTKDELIAFICRHEQAHRHEIDMLKKGMSFNDDLKRSGLEVGS